MRICERARYVLLWKSSLAIPSQPFAPAGVAKAMPVVRSLRYSIKFQLLPEVREVEKSYEAVLQEDAREASSRPQSSVVSEVG